MRSASSSMAAPVLWAARFLPQGRDVFILIRLGGCVGEAGAGRLVISRREERKAREERGDQSSSPLPLSFLNSNESA